LRAPGKWLAELFLWSVKHTAFVREARDNVALWARNMRKIEDAHGLDENPPRPGA
jgi:beta-hydroxylase